MTERRSALIVAVDHYEDPALNGLLAPAADAQALADVLGDEDVGGWGVSVLSNATDGAIRVAVQRILAQRTRDDLVILHFSCHGLKNDAGELFLAASNTQAELPDATGVSAPWIGQLMQRSRAGSVVLFLDCCYGGAFDRGFVGRADSAVHVEEQFDQGSLGGGRGRVVVTASGATEFALEGGHIVDQERVEPSVFTGALVDGLRSGEADRNEDGYVDLDELYDHVFNEVRMRTPNMTPELSAFGQRGAVRIARSPRRRIVPSDLPPDLLDALSGNQFSRIGAVHALEGLARGRDLPPAAAAALELQKLVDDDSHTIRNTARTTLEDIRAKPPSDTLDVGVIASGSGPHLVTLPLTGAPVGLAATVRTSHPGVRALIEDTTLRVKISTAELGAVDATLELTSPAGTSALRVTASVVAAQGEHGPATPSDAPAAPAPAASTEPPRDPDPPAGEMPAGSADGDPMPTTNETPSELLATGSPAAPPDSLVAGIELVAGMLARTLGPDPGSVVVGSGEDTAGRATPSRS